MAVLNSLEPKPVFHYFEEITRIPHGSYNTKEISDYCADFAKARNLRFWQDSLNNIIIKKPGTPGYESSPPIIIQGHMDMVCEKTLTSAHDFQKDPLDIYVEDGFVKARDTTLGADDGIAVAMALALLDSTDIIHPPLEVVLTTEEETGMEGAEGIDLSVLEGTNLLNLDSEDGDTIIAGCAGGFRFKLTLPVHRQKRKGDLVEVRIQGLKGGHSGTEIVYQRGNANKLAGRLLNSLLLKLPAEAFSLLDITGGAKDNVIPSSCCLKLITDDSQAVRALIEESIHVWKQEFGEEEPSLEAVISVDAMEENTAARDVLTNEDMQKTVFFLSHCPNGVYEYSRGALNLPDTSDNLGVISASDDQITFHLLVRSLTASKLQEMKESLIGWAGNLQACYEISGEYPAWRFKKESAIRHIASRAFTKIYGKEPVIETIHAGLECGLLTGKKPELDCVSFGPLMYDIHSVNERLSIESTGIIWKILLEILKECK